ncbi:MAG: hypothetical protein EA428_14085, partial [Spirochaetaceae bacterium]
PRAAQKELLAKPHQIARPLARADIAEAAKAVDTVAVAVADTVGVEKAAPRVAVIVVDVPEMTTMTADETAIPAEGEVDGPAEELAVDVPFFVRKLTRSRRIILSLITSIPRFSVVL